MKTFVQIALLLAPAVSFVAIAHEEPDDQEFRRLEIAWTEAVRAQDKGLIESFLAPDYTLTVAQPAGLIFTDRATWLKNATTTYKVHDFAFKEIAVRRYGDVAVVSSIYTQRATVNGRERSGDAFLTDVWVKVSGKWKVSARYSSDPKPRVPQVPPDNSSKPTPLRGSA